MRQTRRRVRTFRGKLLILISVVPWLVLIATLCINYFYTKTSRLCMNANHRFSSRLEFKARQLNEFFEKVVAFPRALATQHRINGHAVVDSEGAGGDPPIVIS